MPQSCHSHHAAFSPWRPSQGRYLRPYETRRRGLGTALASVHDWSDGDPGAHATALTDATLRPRQEIVPRASRHGCTPGLTHRQDRWLRRGHLSSNVAQVIGADAFRLESAPLYRGGFFSKEHLLGLLRLSLVGGVLRAQPRKPPQVRIGTHKDVAGPPDGAGRCTKSWHGRIQRCSRSAAARWRFCSERQSFLISTAH